ncbi:rhodanese-like domain-containing protein [Roseitranquillus sediminis]|uniref:rhodanese-like domain-containing protein n=1 Tax=Roseitranquillus sediminis TaxID=2809051 RepID=UPI001D0C9783|nr:rhodanese-like domain-containing protein [Roseitranquillus sediminis]MBM9593701.1 rhodanese-like domain-containing protein [Roseitranquillus sediminis]
MSIRPVSELVADAKARVRSISPQEAREAAERGALLVDIRDIRELDREGRVPGAFHAPRGMLEFWVDPASPYYKEALSARPLILFCAAASRSALAADALQQMGVPHVSEIEGGFGAWRDAGLPISR